MSTPDRSSGPGAEISVAAIQVPPVDSSASRSGDRPAISPVLVEERISALDTIRGFGLLGILLMNITFFGLPEAAYSFPVVAGGSTDLNLFTWCVITVIADGKMRAIFSLAFGASVYLLVDRLSRKGAAAEAADIHYRRMLWLLLFGMIHAYFIWGGDILFIYAMLGLLLYPLRRLSPRSLFIGAGALLLVLTSFSAYQYFYCVNLHSQYDQIQAGERAGKKLTADQEEKKKEWEDIVKPIYPSADELKKETDAHLGSYFQLFAFRAKDVYSAHSHPLYYPWAWYDPLFMMLIGMALLKLGVLSGSYPAKFYVWMALLSFAVGLPAHLWTVWWPINQHFAIDALYSTAFAYDFARFTAFGYVALLILAVKSGVLRSATRTLAFVGRMAFSNYILTSLMCTTIFEGYGFGLFGKLQRYQLYGIVLLVWAVILILSPIWLRHFRFGPLEWVWRSLTYWKKQPFRIDARSVV
jgi:uncharacterized protein